MVISNDDTAVVIANGPSLASVPNDWLSKYYTLGSNRVWLKYNPDLLALVDIKMVFTPKLQREARASFENSKDVFISEDASKYLYKGRRVIPEHVKVTPWFNYYDEDGKLLPVFSERPDQALVSGGTVTYGLLQLAWWKGFRRVLLVGLNHTFRDSRGDHFDDGYNNDVGIPYDRENIDDYGHEPGKWFWSEENFVKKTNAFYDVARKFYAKNGGEIVNATPDSKCVVFPIDDWRNW